MTIYAAVLVFLLALGLTLYPLISNQYNQQHQSQIHTAYQEQVEQMEDEDIQNDVGNRHSPTTIVAAISTQIRTKANLPTHYHLKPGSGLVQPSMVMLEQIRTVDKTRLVQYIGKLSDGEIKGLNHALAISIGLIPTTPGKLTLCLCSTCAENFYGSGAYYLRRVNPIEVEKELCTYCNQRVGFDYEITPRHKGR